MSSSATSGRRYHRYLHRVTFAECTVGNHIYHSRYLDLMEAARGEFLRAIGHSVQALWDAGCIFPVIEAHLHYRRPARYDDLLRIDLTLSLLQGVRLGVHHRMERSDGILILEAETLHVCTDLDDKPRRMPAELVQALGPWLESREGGHS